MLGNDMTLRLSFSQAPHYYRLMRLDRPIGIYLLLWPTLWAVLMASDGHPSVGLTLIFVAGVVVMRSAGCVINDYADRHFDGSVKRTKQRPIVAGDVHPKEALQLFALMVLVAFCLVLLLNWQTIALSFVALGLAACYPFMKRITHLPQFVLGAAYSFAIPMAIMATNATIPLWGWGLFIANLLWTVAYDTMYAMVDRDDDIQIGVKSTARLFGRHDKLIIGLLQLGVLIILVWVFQRLDLGVAAYAGLVGMAGFFLYEQWLIRDRERDPCFHAFLNNHYAGLAVLLGLAAHYWWP